MVKITGKNERRFERSSVILKLNVEGKNYKKEGVKVC